MQHTETSRPPPFSQPVAIAGVLFASVCFGLVPYFTRGLTEQGVAPHAVAFYRYVIAAVLLLPALIRHVAAWREILWGMLAGVLMGLGWIGYVTALQSLPASTVGVLYMTYPVFTLIIAWALFADPPARRGLAAAGLILLAAVIAGAPRSVEADQLGMVLTALAAPCGFGFGICVLVYRLARIAPLARMASVSLGAALGLLPLVLRSDPQALLPADRADWTLILGIGLVTALVPQLIYTVCSPLIGAARTAVIGSVELPTMVAVGVLAFGEALTLAQAAACLLILAAITLSGSRRTRSVSTVAARPPRR